MIKGLGGYRTDGGSIRLATTGRMDQIFDCAAATKGLGFDEIKKVGNGKAQSLLTLFGRGGRRAAKKLLPGKVDYFAAHGSIQLRQGGKPVLDAVRELKNPIRSFVADNLKNLFKRIL